MRLALVVYAIHFIHMALGLPQLEGLEQIVLQHSLSQR